MTTEITFSRISLIIIPLVPSHTRYIHFNANIHDALKLIIESDRRILICV